MSADSKAAKDEIRSNRNKAYQGGWDDGYAEGFGKGTDLTQAAVAAALEGAAQTVDTLGDSAVTEALSTRLCCDGHMCGCQGADVGAYILHHIRAMVTAPQRDALQAVIDAAKAGGYLNGFGAAVSNVEAMRASDGLLRGQSLIVTGLKISLTKMTASQIGAKP